MCFTSLVRSPSRLSLTTCVLHYKPALPLGRAFPSARSHYLSVSLLRINFGSTGISTRCPSSTPFGLDLGPDLPWADEPSPGNLRLSTAEFLAPLSLLMPGVSRSALATYAGILSSMQSTTSSDMASARMHCSSTDAHSCIPKLRCCV